METDVNQLLRDLPVDEQFAPYCYVSKDADALMAYFKDEPDYSKRLTDHVTLFLSQETEEIVGCRIKGIASILEDLPNYIKINHGDVELSFLFWSFRGSATDEETREALNRLGQAASEKGLKLEPA